MGQGGKFETPKTTKKKKKSCLSGRERKEEKREEGVMQDHWSQCFLEHD
jgi:hypothetical protein